MARRPRAKPEAPPKTAPKSRPAAKPDRAPRTRSWLGRMLRLLMALTLGFLTLGPCLDLLLRTIRQSDPAPDHPWAVGVGVFLGLVLILWRRPSAFFVVFIHECCHALACILLRVPIHGFSATLREGGAVTYAATGPIRETLIAIAPYVLPLLLAPVLGLRALVPTGATGMVLSGLAALLYLLHVQGVLINVRQNAQGPDADLPKVGRPLALVLVADALLLTTTWVLWSLWPTASTT